MDFSTLLFQPPSETPFRQPIPAGVLIFPPFPSFFLPAGVLNQHNPNTPAQKPIPTLLPTRRFSSLDSCHYQYCFDCQYTLAPLSAMWEKPGVLEIKIKAPPFYSQPLHDAIIRLFLMFLRLPDSLHATFFALCFNRLFIYLAFLEIMY